MAYYKTINFDNYNRTCEFCGEYSGKINLCQECLNLAKEGYILYINGKWIKNVKKGNEYKFYDETKTYTLKTTFLNKYELDFYNIVRHSLKSKFTIIPQVNLQTIVSTDTNTRNDELFRQLDFVIYYAEIFVPFLAIELNGQQHYTNEYWKERDKSVKSILDKIGLPLLTIDIKDLKNMTKKDIQTLITKVINYLNPNILKRFLGKQEDKMDLSWTKQLIKKTRS